jgi:RHS repeat-associated protein
MPKDGNNIKLGTSMHSRLASELMQPVALTTDRDYYIRAANEDCLNGGPRTRTKYLYDGLNPATIGGSQILAGQGLDDFYAQTSAGSTTSYLSDALGSTVALTDSNGAVAGSYTYGPYGATSHSGTADTSFQYTARENDGDTNLYYYRARYYSASLNRFVSQDPLGLGGGVNVYAYAWDNPVSFTDPTGNCPWCAIAAIQGAIAYIGLSSSLHNAAADAAQYWADLAVQTGNPLYNIPGALAALADPCHAGSTSAVLGIGAGIGTYLGRPYWQYSPGNSPYSSQWLTRGWGWSAPYQEGTQAVGALALPPWNPALAVTEVNPSMFEYVAGPRIVAPNFGQLGGGVEYAIGGFP